MSVKWPFLLLPGWLFSYSPVISQNLVVNGSFESVKREPAGFSAVPKDLAVTGWVSPTLGTPDYFSIYGYGQARVPCNWTGCSDAMHGGRYAGFYTGAANEFYREYLLGELLSPLDSDLEYTLSMWVKAAPLARYRSLQVSALLLQKSFNAPFDSLIENADAITFRGDFSTWKQVSIVIKPEGGERFILIGNLLPRDATVYAVIPGTKKEKMLNMSSYLIIDDVRLTPKISPLPYDSAFTLDNVYFEFDSDILYFHTHRQLDNLANFLHFNPALKLEIIGNTDTTGSVSYNQQLGMARAVAVKDYLMNIHQVEESRMRLKTVGEELAYYTLDSLNRRVIFRINNSSTE